jgi:hypothetical protein
MTLIVDKPKSFFGTNNDNDDNSNTTTNRIIIKAFVSDWVMQGLVRELNSPRLDAVCSVVRDLVSILEHEV